MFNSSRKKSLLLTVLVRILSVLFIGTGALCAVLLLIFNTTAKDEIRNYIEEMGYRYLNRARLEIAGPISSADTISTVLKEIINPASSLTLNGRYGMQELVTDSLSNFPDVFGIGVYLEPDVFDLDSMNTGAEHSTREGRFALLVYRSADSYKTARGATSSAELESLPYYRDVKGAGNTLISDPFVFSPDSKEKSERVIAVTSPIMHDSRFAGVTVFYITLESLENICFSDIKIFKSGYMHLISPSGLYAYAGDDPSIVLTDVRARLDQESLTQLDNAHYNYAPSRVVRQSPSLNKLVETEFIPFKFTPSGKTWILAVLYPIDEALKPVMTGMTAGITISIAVLLGAGILIFFIIRAIVQSFNELIQLTNTLSSGDFSVTVPEKRLAQANELGDMARSFKIMIANIRNVVSTMKEASRQLLESGLSLSANAEETNGQVRSIGNNIERVVQFTDTQITSVRDVSVSINEIVKNIEKLESVIVSQASAVTQSSAGIEEMIGNISSINGNIAKITSQFEELVRSSLDGVKKQEQVESKIHEIVDLSETLNETNTIIASIAAQTNLLAMNAAIESAHAGEAGKGFAVVSDEIRKLAEQATEQSKEVAKQLKAIGTGIESIVETSAQTRISFDTIASQIDQTSGLVTQVHSAVSEQSSGSQQILEGIRTINSITHDVKNSAVAMRGESREISEKVSQLKTVSSQVHESLTQVASSVDEIDSAANSVLTVAVETKNLIGKVTGEVERFTI